MLTVDRQVFKIKDPRVTALSAARLPVEQFIHTIKPGDWFIFFNKTVYALTQDQYYAAQQLNAVEVLTKEQFEAALILQSYNQTDLKQVQYIRDHKAGCSKCQYNAYKNKLLKIINKYPNIIKELGLDWQLQAIREYPQTTAPVNTKVSKIFPRFFDPQPYERLSCLDCVEKHVTQAFQKGTQTLQGYPEHLKLAITNLEEAFEECPKDCTELRDLLIFCIGKTKKDKRIFVPIRNFWYLIEMSRAQTAAPEALDQNQPDESFDIVFSQEVLSTLSILSPSDKAQALVQVEKLLRVEYSTADDTQKALYQGAMANLAQFLSPFCPEISNVLRNRRLMFKFAPQLVQNTEYDCKDLKEALIHPVKVQEKDSSDSGTAERA